MRRKSGKQIISPFVRFGQSSRGPYANRIGQSAYARNISLGERDQPANFQAFGTVGSVIKALVRGEGAVTFSRPNTAPVETGPDGLTETAVVDELRHEKGMRVENFFNYTEDITNDYWIKTNCTADSETLVTFEAQFSLVSVFEATNESDVYTFSFKARRISGNANLHMRHNNSGSGNQTAITLTDTLQRFSVTVNGRTGGGTVQFGLQDRNSSGFGQSEVTEWQLEKVTGRSNQNCRQYVSVGMLSGADGQYHGAGVDGVAYYAETNPWEVSNNVATETAATTPLTDYRTLLESAVNDDASPMFDIANFDITKGTFVWDLTMAAAVDQGIIGFSNAQAGLCSYNATAGRFETTDGSNIAFVDPSLASNLGDIIRFAVLYNTGNGLRIGYRNITDAGSWVWDTNSAAFSGSFPSDDVFNVVFGLATSTTFRDLEYYRQDKTEQWIEDNF